MASVPPTTGGGRRHGGSDTMQGLYAIQGRAHATLASAARDLRGQGTVEYVGLILLVAVILAGVVKASGGLKDSTIAEAVIKKLKGAIDSVGEGGRSRRARTEAVRGNLRGRRGAATAHGPAVRRPPL